LLILLQLLFFNSILLLINSNLLLFKKETINDYKIDDFVVTDYFPYEKIDMEMAI